MASAELYWLTLSLLMTACLWLPYILKLVIEVGLITALTDPMATRDFSADWATRARKAHNNAVENLVVFAPLALLVGLLDIGNALTATAAMVFFVARLGHYLVYVAGIALLRTVFFAVGWTCTMIMGLRLLTLI